MMGVKMPNAQFPQSVAFSLDIWECGSEALAYSIDGDVCIIVQSDVVLCWKFPNVLKAVVKFLL